jgi:hypothetical protein
MAASRQSRSQRPTSAEGRLTEAPLPVTHVQHSAKELTSMKAGRTGMFRAMVNTDPSQFIDVGKTSVYGAAAAAPKKAGGHERLRRSWAVV